MFHGSSSCCCRSCLLCCGHHGYPSLHWIRVVRQQCCCHCWPLRHCPNSMLTTSTAGDHPRLHASSLDGDRFPPGVPWSAHACKTTYRASTATCHRPEGFGERKNGLRDYILKVGKSVYDLALGLRGAILGTETIQVVLFRLEVNWIIYVLGLEVHLILSRLSYG